MRLNPTAGLASVALALVLAACSQPAPQAQAPAAPPAPPPPPAVPNIADLVDAKASSGEMDLENRGFTNVRHKGLTAFWYHAPTNTCVRVVTANGRYKTVAQTQPSNCGH